MNGFLVIDKPPGLTSHDVVALVRAVTGVPKVGHTGTLDPFATGVLPLALGGATRFIQHLDERLKVYDATIRLGFSTTTGDPEGEVLREAPVPDLSGVEQVLAGLVGPRMQTPPAYSAVKVAGQPLYRYARRGEAVEVAARPIELFAVKLLERGEDTLRVEIHCTRGTYARVLADEIGSALGSAGHLCALRRLGSGPFTLERALSLGQLSQLATGLADWEHALRPQRGAGRVPWRPRAEVHAALQPWVWSLDEVLSHLPVLAISPGQAHVGQNGGPIPCPPELPEGGMYRVHAREALIGLGQRQGDRGVLALRVEAPPAARRRN